MAANKCPHPTCQKPKPFDNYACSSHWFSLPKSIRDAIWKAYRENGALSPQWLAADKQAQKYWECYP
jgi:hypothetical protein